MLGTLDFTGSEQWAPFDVIFFIEQSLVPTLLTNHTNRELEKFKDWSLRNSNWQGLSPMQYFLNKANVLCKVFRDGLFSWKRSPPRRIKSTCWKKKAKNYNKMNKLLFITLLTELISWLRSALQHNFTHTSFWSKLCHKENWREVNALNLWNLGCPAFDFRGKAKIF